MKPEISVFMAIKNAFMGFSRHLHGIFMKKRFIVIVKYTYTSPKVIRDNDEFSSLRSQLFEMVSGELNAFNVS